MPSSRLGMRYFKLTIAYDGTDFHGWQIQAGKPTIQGEIVEYASTYAVPITHRAGEVATETHATSHWWKNLGNQTVVLLSADLFPDTAADHHMM